jgi:dipicolinate synthase subunit A
MGGGVKKADYHFVIDCGDKRNRYLMTALTGEGYRTDEYDPEKRYESDADGVFLFAPAAELTVAAAQKIPSGSRVFCIKCDPEVLVAFGRAAVKVFYYFDDELLAMKNAYLTAEGALALVIEHTDRSLKDLRALVLGGGRVGKSMAKLLHDNRCRVYLATIDAAEYAFASIFSDGVYKFSEYPEYLGTFDLIVNTVPELILKGEKLEGIGKECFILDLASKPGGVDFAAAERLGLKTAHALGLPGKTAPYSAALALKESVLNTLSRESLELVKNHAR